jgi:photosystem II stability/assembly factor-like uncharacterized protein
MTTEKLTLKAITQRILFLVLLILNLIFAIQAQKSSDDYIKVVESILDKNDNLTQVFFISHKVGWIVGESHLYKTINSGISWKKMSFFIKRKEQVSKFQFINEKVGLAIVQRKASFDDETQNYKVLKTTNGGRTWKTLKSEKNPIISGVVFSHSLKSR